jgi:hypothetical protein
MFEYEKLGKQYGATVTIIRGLQIITVPTRSTLKVDVGFGVGQGNLFSGAFPFFRRHEFGRNLFIFDTRASALSRVLSTDDRLCSLLRLILDDYAFRVEWSGTKLAARINTLQGFPSNDGTGGERMFSALKLIADRLEAIDAQSVECSTSEYAGWGPGRVHRIALMSVFALPAVCYMVLRYWAYHFLLHH